MFLSLQESYLKMPQVARMYDTCDHDFAPIGRDGKGIESTVLVNSRPIAVTDGTGDGATGPCGLWRDNLTPAGDGFDTHPLGRSPLYPPGSNPPGVPGPTTGSNTVFAGGLPVHRFNDGRGCGAETNTASPDVWADFVEKIRIEGATVNEPKASPAAPTLWAYPPGEFYMFSDLLPGLFFVRSPYSDSKLFQFLDQNDFVQWGTEIRPTLEFEDITDEDKFKVPDLDLAVRKSSIPLGLDLGIDDPTISVSFAGGLQAKGFPSYGEVRDLDGLGTISGKGTVDTWQDFYRPGYDVSGFLISITPTSYTGYPTYIANESGNGLSYTKLLIMPTFPKQFLTFGAP